MEEKDLSSLFNASCTMHEKLEADDADANELTALRMDSNTHDPVEAWQKLNDAKLNDTINKTLCLICFGSNEVPGEPVNKKDVEPYRKLANHYMCAYNGGILLLEDKEAQMLRDVIASREPSVFLVKMHAFCEYLRDKKNSEDKENHEKKPAQKNRALKVRRNSTFKNRRRK